MITKFLYHLSKDNRRILSGLVVNDNDENVDVNNYPIFPESVSIDANEKKIINHGDVGYLVFGDKYLDVNIYNGNVVINVTDNISHASCYSYEFFMAILDNVSNLDDDFDFVESGLRIDGDLYHDEYKIFKSIKDASYCMLKKDGKYQFVARDDNNRYYLTDVFEDASKINKNELRRVLIINKFITIDTPKSEISFSSYKYLSNDMNEYIYAGRKPFKIRFENGNIEISFDFNIDDSFKLRNNEEIFLQLKDVSYLLFKEKTNKTYYLETSNKKYVRKIDNLKYELVSNPYYATSLDDYEIEIIKSATKVINPSEMYRRKNKNKYLYYDGNEYGIYNEANKEYVEGRMLEKKDFEGFVKAFDISFNKEKRDSGIILICNNKYLNIEIVNKTKFKVLLTDASYNASLFSQEEAKAIKTILGFDFKERVLENILQNDLNVYNIHQGKPNVALTYRKIMDELLSKKTALSDYTNIMDLKLESEKVSLEYLRRFYLKAVCDYKALFESVLTDKTKKVLIVAPRLNIELQGLELAAKHNVEVYTLNELKYGYLPEVILNKVKYKGNYKLKFQNLPVMFLKEFDIILFGAGFKETPEEIKSNMELMSSGDKEYKILYSRLLFAQSDNIYEYFKDIFKIKRKYYTYDLPYKELIDEYDEKYVSYLVRNRGRIHNKVVRNKEESYYSAINLGKTKIENIF